MKHLAEFLTLVLLIALFAGGLVAHYGCQVQVQDRTYYIGPPRDGGAP